MRLTTEQALALLPHGDRIHTRMQGASNTLFEIDSDRSYLEKIIAQSTCEWSGLHGLVVHFGSHIYFVETKVMSDAEKS